MDSDAEKCTEAEKLLFRMRAHKFVGFCSVRLISMNTPKADPHVSLQIHSIFSSMFELPKKELRGQWQGQREYGTNGSQGII